MFYSLQNTTLKKFAHFSRSVRLQSFKTTNYVAVRYLIRQKFVHSTQEFGVTVKSNGMNLYHVPKNVLIYLKFERETHRHIHGEDVYPSVQDLYVSL